MITLDQAKSQVITLLDLAKGDHEAVFRAIVRSRQTGCQYAGYTEDEDDDYGMLRLALADLTGISAYRG